MILRNGKFDAEGEVTLTSFNGGVIFKFALPSRSLILVMARFSSLEGFVCLDVGGRSRMEEDDEADDACDVDVSPSYLC